ncbi:cytochrome C oxidase subunit IV family protein [Mycobacterium sp. TY815]|uniref:cytochrome C oxidase subunit IV family protein n=1 Tax=Mycobacterium sp. TY815 TaxID=3050581 RepID=UPI002741953A|nr:cytochrome C oxidase subunit IV family protein [Mycobacterium sp. TY815]MDP7705123.1 cytochrome C oxidase subunit IV family protein [Mycobacterium sp. TY815]
MSVLQERITRVWLALIALTCLTTWGLSKDLFSPAVTVVGTFLIAAVKVRYVILDFMELRQAPLPVRAFFEAWPAVVTAVILGCWFAAG